MVHFEEMQYCSGFILLLFPTPANTSSLLLNINPFASPILSFDVRAFNFDVRAFNFDVRALNFDVRAFNFDVHAVNCTDLRAFWHVLVLPPFHCTGISFSVYPFLFDALACFCSLYRLDLARLVASFPLYWDYPSLFDTLACFLYRRLVASFPLYWVNPCHTDSPRKLSVNCILSIHLL